MTSRRPPSKRSPVRVMPPAAEEALVARVVRIVLARLRADYPELFPPPAVPPSAGTPSA